MSKAAIIGKIAAKSKAAARRSNKGAAGDYGKIPSHSDCRVIGIGINHSIASSVNGKVITNSQSPSAKSKSRSYTEAGFQPVMIAGPDSLVIGYVPKLIHIRRTLFVVACERQSP